jgi:Putative peptidoglycan binding domain/CHAP domain
MPTRAEALATMRSYVGKARNVMPWLKKRPKLYDCAAGYSYCATGKVTKYVWVHEMVDLMKKNGTWKKGKPQPGDAVIYDWNGDGGCDHVAMFHSVAKNGQWITYGADQGKPSPGKVSKLQTGKGVILGWGTPFKFDEAGHGIVTPTVTTEPAHAETDMEVKPEHYAPAEPVSPVEAPKVEIPAVVAPEIFKVLNKGDKGAYVKKLQTALKVTADGDFGPITEKAVKAYQTKKGIVVTGVVDIETWKRLGL